MSNAEFIVKLGYTGAEIARVTDHPKTAEAVLGFIRAGLHVDYRCADEPQAPQPALTASPLPLNRPLELAKPRRNKRLDSGKPRVIDYTKFGARKYAIGDTAYLAWSLLDDEQRLHLSKYRTTLGKVVEKRSGHMSTGVRFNGDPDTIWLKPIQLAVVPEAE